MRKVILTAFILGLLSFSAKAQYFGIKGGLNFSNLNVGDIDNIDDENMRPGYHFGAYINLPITEGFALQPEVLYSTKGNKIHYNADLGPLGNIDQDITTKLDYIDIPILAVIRIGEIAEIEVGPYFGFLANSKLEFDETFEGSEDLDSDDFKNLDYGISGGLAVNLALLQVGARYNYGLQKVSDSDAADLFYGDGKNSYFQLFAALRFGDY